MPELPEVETVRRGLAPAMEGFAFDRVRVNRADLRFPFPPDFVRRLNNRKVLEVSRRAKYLVIVLDEEEVLIAHLGMSGSFHVISKQDHDETQLSGSRKSGRLSAHDHVIFYMKRDDTQYTIIYNDPRRFGFMDLIRQDELAEHRFFADMGIEPTGNSLDGELLRSLFSGRKTPLKSALLDQKLIAGLGNIYVCEALWQAGLSPRRKSETLSTRSAIAKKRATALAGSIRDVIHRAIEAGGSSLRDHRQTDGTLGYFQHSFNVYDREGDACAKADCEGTIRRITQSGRSTYYCPECQV